jgi:hypothetical protein
LGKAHEFIVRNAAISQPRHITDPLRADLPKTSYSLGQFALQALIEQ